MVKDIIEATLGLIDNYYESIMKSKYTGVFIVLYFLAFSLYQYYYKSFDIDTLAVLLLFTLIIGIFFFTAFYKPRVGIVMLIPPIYFIMLTIMILYNPKTFISLGTALVGSLFVYGTGKFAMGIEIHKEKEES